MKKFLFVGAGFSNAVIARELAEQGYQTTVIDLRNHVAGNCHSERDPEYYGSRLWAAYFSHR